jgi:histone-lysine N-methyltransferase SETMAR
MLSVWWNFEGVLHFEMVPEGRSVNADLYCQQLDRVYATIREKYPTMINQKRVLL